MDHGARGSLAKIHSPRAGRGNEVKSSGPRARNIDHGLGIALRDTRPHGAERARARKSACFRARTAQSRQAARYLNFKSANVYFCHGPRNRSALVFSSSFSIYLFPRVIGRLSRRFEFQIRSRIPPPCRTPQQQPTFECFYPLMRCHLFPSFPGSVYVCGHRDLRRTVSSVPHFYLWRHPVCIRIDSVIYFAADNTGLRRSGHEKANFEASFRSPSTLRAAKRFTL